MFHSGLLLSKMIVFFCLAGGLFPGAVSIIQEQAYGAMNTALFLP
jgi:hypothetical protein